MLAGTRSSFSRSSSHCSVLMLNSIVRDALRDVGDVRRVARELPDQPAVDGPERQLAGLGLARARRDVVEDPCDLAAGKIRVDDEAGAFADEVFVPVALQSIAVVGRAPVLPHDRVVDGSAGLSIPDDRRLALVGDADGRDISWAQVRASERLGGDGDLCGPDLIGIVLDPARTRKDLLEFPLADGHDSRRRDRRRWRASSSCPDRARGCTA